RWNYLSRRIAVGDSARNAFYGERGRLGSARRRQDPQRRRLKGVVAKGSPDRRVRADRRTPGLRRAAVQELPSAWLGRSWLHHAERPDHEVLSARRQLRETGADRSLPNAGS